MSEQLALFTQPVPVAMPPVNAARDLVAQERAALVTAHLYTHKAITVAEARALTGLTYCAVWYLMSKVARVLPVWYERAEKTWRIE